MQKKFASRFIYLFYFIIFFFFLAFLKVYYPKTHQIKSFNSLDSSRPYRMLLENHTLRASRELFPPENHFQTCTTKIFFRKNIQILATWKATENMKFRLEYFCSRPSTYELNIKPKLFWAIIRNMFKVP